MRKIIFGLSALLMCFVFASCTDPVKTLEGLAEDIEKNGAEWDADKWVDVTMESSKAELSFWESNPSQEEIDKFKEAKKKCTDAIGKLWEDEKAAKALKEADEKLDKDNDYKELLDKIKDAKKEAKDKLKEEKKDKKDKDEDED